MLLKFPELDHPSWTYDMRAKFNVAWDQHCIMHGFMDEPGKVFDLISYDALRRDVIATEILRMVHAQ